MKGGESQKDHLLPEEISSCNDAVESFIKSTDPTESIIMNSRLKLNQCFYHFKSLYKNALRKGGGGVEGAGKTSSDFGDMGGA